ncbi:unnamed protein product [Mucor hiemalis]
MKKRRSAIRISNSTNSIAQSIQIAYILMHIYRDFSGCTAILASLQMPEVQRLEKLWSQCSLKIVSTYKELVKLLSPERDYEAYYHHLWLHTARFLNATPLKSRMVAVPFMQAHLASIRNLIHTHSAVMNSNKQNIVLSEAGKKYFLSAIHVLEFCQHLTKIDPTELNRPITLASASRRLSSNSNKRSSISTTGFKLSISTCLELDKLHTSAKTYHWIVSRPYLTRAQLHQESLQVEPLAIGEIELESEEEYDLYWDFFSQPLTQTISETQKKKDSSPVSILKEIAKIDTLVGEPENEELSKSQPQIDEQDIVNDLMIVEPNQGESSDIKTNDVVSSIPHCSAKDPTENNENEGVSIKEHRDEADKCLEEVAIEVKKENLLPKEIEITEDDADVLDTQVVDEDQPPSTTTTVKPILSPTAPEFIPQKHHYNSSLDEDDDDIIIITEEMSYTADIQDKQDVEEEEEEEWTGYPLDNTSSSIIEESIMDHDEDDEEEEWTGYPINSQDEDEDDDEVWKGYPAPKQSQQLSLSPNLIELSSPSIPQNLNLNSGDTNGNGEWKGFEKPGNEEQNISNGKTLHTTGTVNKDYPISWDNNKNQLHAIGKAAARKLQYSISTTDNRKRLPTIFTPSAST